MTCEPKEKLILKYDPKANLSDAEIQVWQALDKACVWNLDFAQAVDIIRVLQLTNSPVVMERVAEILRK